MAMYRLVSSVKVQKVRAFGTLGKPNTDGLDNGHSNWQNTLVITGAEYMHCQSIATTRFFGNHVANAGRL